MNQYYRTPASYFGNRVLKGKIRITATYNELYKLFGMDSEILLPNNNIQAIWYLNTQHLSRAIHFAIHDYMHFFSIKGSSNYIDWIIQTSSNKDGKILKTILEDDLRSLRASKNNQKKINISSSNQENKTSSIGDHIFTGLVCIFLIGSIVWGEDTVQGHTFTHKEPRAHTPVTERVIRDTIFTMSPEEVLRRTRLLPNDSLERMYDMNYQDRDPVNLNHMEDDEFTEYF